MGEYFQKLLGQWQEGEAAEVTVADVDVDVFENFLAYVHNGTVEYRLELEALVKLISLAEKYLMNDLVASCFLRIISILQDGCRMKKTVWRRACRIARVCRQGFRV